MATSSFQKNFIVTKEQGEFVASIIGSNFLNSNLDSFLPSKFSLVDDYKEELDKIFKVRTT
ncbi:hypothetical protein QQG09_08835 [Melissococcus plutonius]|uniref:hypothetical protein n=1 Tax=Melissococcus plutonius TaxID=33970 RepID=UPI0021E5AB9F|nr:hypothetical protein [Melissococcus plutonius]MCV2499005.1 hypothetical protein [Melissococcus plutonius]MCV2501921.1 hypothetical protein [Melissococcus plutonius]MCV2504141.1 hypothetical protein [Melissococcus plutonius]MCV2507622.1 hypothetical protein [Melissococcus plutonius]MCV2519976.1 hypothetical protein [Melissococcus plutonius]